MDVLDVIRNRRSVRSYADKPVERDKIQRLLEAARLAPSASNRQEWKFVVVREPETRRKLMEAAYGQKFVGQAPVVIAACAAEHDHVMACGHPCFAIDVAIAIDHMTLAARALGLGTWQGIYFCEFDGPRSRKLYVRLISDEG